MRKKWTTNDYDFLIKNYNIMSILELSDSLGRSVSSINTKLSKLKLSSRKWSKEDDDLMIQYFSSKTIVELLELFPNRSESSIINRGYLLGLKCDYNLRKTERKYKYNVSHNFFSKHNINSCYWGGFISADGWVMTANTSSLGIKLSIKDYDHLIKFKNEIKTDSPIFIKEGMSFGKKNKTCMISIYSKQIITDLRENFNIVPNKTLVNKPPKIDDNLNKLSFIIGLMDGDGTVYKDKNGYMRITFLGSYEILEWVKKTLVEFLGEIKSKINKKNKIYSFSISNNLSLKLINIVKKNNMVYLNRKIDKYGE
jgi:hypothetical protein